jgi:hypothetical protein
LAVGKALVIAGPATGWPVNEITQAKATAQTALGWWNGLTRFALLVVAMLVVAVLAGAVTGRSPRPAR